MLVRPFATRPWNGWFQTLDELERARRSMDSLFRDVYGQRPSVPGAGVFPLANVTEDQDAYYVRAELPGVAPDAVEISVTGNTLSVSGERRPDVPEGASFHRRERRSGTFARTITMPSDIDGEKVEARAENGVFTIRLPKAEAAKPRQIAVKA